MISKSISKHPGTEDTAQQCLGAPGAAPDCQSPASWTDGFVHRYQQWLIRWKTVIPATGNSRNLPSENFTNTFSHSSGIWLFASFTTSLLRVFSSKALKNFLIVKGRELLTDCTPVTRTHFKINYHVVFGPINTPLLKITSTVRSSAPPWRHLHGSHSPRYQLLNTNELKGSKSRDRSKDAHNISAFTHHPWIWGAEKEQQNLSYQRAHLVILRGTQNQAEQRAQLCDCHWCRAKAQPGAWASLMLQRLRFI